MERTCNKVAAGEQEWARQQLVEQAVPHVHMDKLGGTNGEWDIPHNPVWVPVWESNASKPLAVKTCGGCGDGRNSQPHRRVCWKDPQGPRTYTNPLTWESAPEGPNLLVGNRGVTERWLTAEQAALFPL